MANLSHEELKQHIQSIDSDTFEHFIADLWEQQGWSTEVTQSSRDRGIDVIATKSSPFDQKQLIQAKRYATETTVSSSEIQQYSSLRRQESNVDSVVVVTSGRFSSQAEDTANRLNVKSIDGDALCRLIDNLDAYSTVKEYADGIPTSENQPSGSQDSTTGWAASESSIVETVPAGVTLEWTAHVGDSAHSIRLTDTQALVLTEDSLIALSLENGSVDWKIKGRNLLAGIGLGDRFATMANLNDGNVHIISLPDGEKSKTFSINEEGFGGGPSRQPVVCKGTIYVAQWSPQGGSVVSAIDPESESIKWTKEWSLSEKVHVPPGVGDDAVYIQSKSGVIRALTLGRGKIRWEREMNARINEKPTVHDGHVYLADKYGKIHRLSTDTGAKNGVLDLDKPTSGRITAYANHLYISGIYKVDPSTGRQVWKTDDLDGSFPVISDESIYCAGEQGISSLTTGGTILWDTPIKSHLRSLDARNNCIAGLSNDGSIICMSD